MTRFALYLALLFLILGLARMVRLWLAGRRRGRDFARPVEGEMVRDPVCGTWIDRRVALSAGRSGDAVPVCSEKCRRALESA
ncbi:MAG TPA: hypothetical protein VFW15_01890 [Thermoanaerobaculia bacterium]|nr:hypothetical protein [Thermoanaerobaculia bacterium]